MRKYWVVAMLAALAMLVTALPAAADPPEEFVITRTMEGEIDPCTGDEMDVHFTWIASAHSHNNNEVIHFDGSAVTSTGYVANGTETLVVDKNWLKTNFNWVNDNADTGAKFTVKGRVKVDLDTGEAVVEDISFHCVKA